ncbi:MAG: HAD-IIB family hydrolase [Spirochaetia bacterium]|nr:HAD-IIB family hydrolase [Spirochaetia bacterium]
MGKKFYIQMFSIHGLIRQDRLEMGRDADTGGQIKYVIELCKELSMKDEVERVDLFTRLISDKTVSQDYSVPVEKVNDKFRIVRIQCGGRKYIRKELLWPFLDEYVDKTVKFIKKEKLVPDIVHGHYADGGYVARELSSFFEIPFLFTGHSLGRNKHAKLLGDGMSENEINRKFRMDTRLKKEEEILSSADMIITSTQQEIDKQYGLYDNKKTPSYKVIPPGIDTKKFYPYYHNMIPEIETKEKQIYAHASVLQELDRFFLKPDKPLILTLCRPEKRKNISGLIKAYGKNLELQAMANLAIFAGLRKSIAEKEDNERDVLTEMLLLMDRFDLYGKMAIPKKHDFELEVPELYRIAAEKKGVFVNAALTEPFGLTLLEAASCGLPIVATDDGGPRDIIHNCGNGIIVDPEDSGMIADALKKIISDGNLWEKYSKNGIENTRKYYTWKAHAEEYVKLLNSNYGMDPSVYLKKDKDGTKPSGTRLSSIKHLFVSDIDGTLIGSDGKNPDILSEIISLNQESLGFAVATGRNADSALSYLKSHKIPSPDIIIASVGTEIYYTDKLKYDRGWHTHISHKWNPDLIREVLSDIPFLKLQSVNDESLFKVSYYLEPGRDHINIIHEHLNRKKCRYTIVYSAEKYLDVIPYRASKGKALRYLSYKWSIPLENILTCGDSGNDEDMLRGDTCAVVVGNYSAELETLRESRKIYFAEKPYSEGIIEGMKHYKFLEKLKENR